MPTRPIRLTALLCLCAMIRTTDGAGQDRLPAPGDRILLRTLAAPDARAARFGGLDGTDLLLDGDRPGGPSRVPLASVVELRAGDGRHRHWREGASLGLALGAAVGSAVRSRGYSGESDTGTLIGMLVGGAAGAFAGSNITSQRWRSVPVRAIRPEPMPGTWVRMEDVQGRRVEGELGRGAGGSLEIRPRAGGAVAVGDQAALEWPTARTRGTRHGAAVGLGLGALLGAGIGLATYHDCSGQWLCFGPGVSAIGGGAIGAFGGVLIGALIGHGSYRTRWERAAAAPPKVSVAPIVSPHSFGLALSRSF